MANTKNTFRAGLWSPYNIDKGGVTLKYMAHFIRCMVVSGNKPNHQGLMREIRCGRWVRNATPCPEHLEHVSMTDSDKLGEVRAVKIAPNRWVLSFTA